jgi:hypothetical protein
MPENDYERSGIHARFQLRPRALGSSVTIEYLKTEANAPEVKKRGGEAGLETAGNTANG